MDIQRKAFESSNNVNPDWSFKFDEELQQYVALDNEMELQVDEFNEHWDTFRAGWQAKDQAVLEQDQQVWATNNLTWKDIAFRALSCKVLKTTQNWVHVKNIACVGSTTASLICRKLGVDPDGTKFELIEAQEQTND